MREKVVQSLLEGVDHIQLPVSDLEKAVDWYTRYLGFELKSDDGVSVDLKLSNGPALMLHQAPTGSNLHWISTGGGLMPAFIFKTNNIHNLRDALASVAKISYFSDEGFAWVLKFCDPFGNELGAIQYKNNYTRDSTNEKR